MMLGTVLPISAAEIKAAYGEASYYDIGYHGQGRHLDDPVCHRLSLLHGGKGLYQLDFSGEILERLHQTKERLQDP